MAGLYDRIVALPWVAPLKPTWQRARVTTSPLRFFLRETFHRRRGAHYRLRAGDGVGVAVRHATLDTLVVDEIFVQRLLAEPAPVAERLDALGRPPRVLDVGANVGLAAAWFAARWPGAEVTCVEPDPLNLTVLRRVVERAGDRWALVEAAAAAAPGRLSFSSGGYAVSHVAEDGDVEVEAIDLHALAAELRPDVLKLDAEGGEWPVLTDPRLADLPAVAVSLEYHPEGAPEPDPRAAAHARLEAAGYVVQEGPPTADAPAGVGMLWAWRA